LAAPLEQQFALRRFGFLENRELGLIDVPLDTLTDQRAELRGRDGIKLDALAVEVPSGVLPSRFVGRVGKLHSVICSGVTAMRSKWMSTSSPACRRRPSSVLRDIQTPEGSWSPKW
jgi:hypothetical protein